MKKPLTVSSSNLSPLRTPAGVFTTVEVKPVWTSWTFWLNTLTIVALFLEQFTQFKVIEFFVKNPVQAELISSWLLGVLAVANILLRLFKTQQPVTLKR